MKKQLFKFLLCLTAVIFAVSCGSSANNSTNDDNTVDGDFKEVDPDENK